ncbi:hypothetical protein CROQUDRAFT_96349 [Cronartium quercuum f. sp. fusiforme G11]|uniref:Uncharacterized protein n=1 Tax=Cronartium quercuum f. sp. fusiforme G11 TaxID=708437 RepID=A0A9P6NB82_9BASI|nr:hypothetical protein CROQUDRAFT_96349 [Cronartium quercuum f. sp. fusiforme G11]
MKRRRSASPSATILKNSSSNKRSRSRSLTSISSHSISSTSSSTEHNKNSPTQDTPKQSNHNQQEIILNPLIKSALHRYHTTEKESKDYRDTISQLSYDFSKNLSRSLMIWEKIRLNRIDHRHQIKDESNHKILDSTSSTFTLWPLKLNSYPKPDWTLDEELEGLALKFNQLNVQINLQNDDDHLSDLDQNEDEVMNLVKQTKDLLENLLIQLYKIVTPTIKKKRQRSQKSSKDVETNKNPSPELDSNSNTILDPGLKWYDVLNVATELGIDQEILKRTEDRLKVIYQLEPQADSEQIPNLTSSSLTRIDSSL